MADENAILSAVLYDRKAYEAVVDHVDPTDLSVIAAAAYETIADYYRLDPKAVAADPAIIQERMVKALPRQEASIHTLMRELTPDRGSVNVVRELLDLKRSIAGQELSMAIASGKSGADVQPVLDKYLKLHAATEFSGGFSVLEKSYADLVRESADPETPIRLYPSALNTELRGGVLPGHCVVIIGRVNVGKSALAIYNIGGMLRSGKRVLLIENEDLPDDVKRRVGCCLVGCSLDWAEQNPDKFDAMCKRYGGDRLIIPDPVPTTCRDVARAVEHFKPDVCVVNQVRHLASDKAAESDNTGAVDRVVQHLRALGKRTRTLMILVGAAKEGEPDREGNIPDKAVLQMADSYGSRTGIPGCADVLIGIGTNDTLRQRGMVAITIAKNKRRGQKRNFVMYQRLNGENCRFTNASEN